MKTTILAFNFFLFLSNSNLFAQNASEYKANNIYLSNKKFKTETIEIPRDSKFEFVDQVTSNGKKYNRFAYTDPVSKELIPVSVPVANINFRSPGTPNLYVQEHAVVPNAGKDCRTVDLKEKFGTPRNQGALKWCYAESVSDYLSYRSGKRLSASDLTIRTHLALKSSSDLSKVDGADSAEVFIEALKDGSCLEANFPSEHEGESIQRAVLEFENFHKKWKSLTEDQKQATCEKMITNPLMQNLKGIDLKTIDEILKRVSSLESIDKIRNIACGPMIKEKENAQLVYEKAGAGLNALDSQLDKDLPAIVQVHSNEFYDVPNPKDEHGMVVVARKMNTAKNRCEYFLRDSRGGKCDSYKRNVDCDKKAGGLWVSQQQLQKMLIETNYLDP
jgi:hypothetical protein